MAGHVHSTNSLQAFSLYGLFPMGNFEEPKHHRNEQVFSARTHAHNLPQQASEKRQ
jgi:hypothetical protein